ncbi:Protein MAIN-LIKE 2 [Linum perenne]
MTLKCHFSKKIVKYDPRFESYLAPIGLEQLRGCLDFTPDSELITALVERWRPETSTFHLYHGEATITLEDVHFLTGLSIEGVLVESQRRIPTVDSDLQIYVERLLGKKPSTADLSAGRVKMTWLRSHFGTIRDDADQETIEQHCRAYILDFFGSCIFADRSGSHASLFFLPLLSNPSRDHVGDIGGWTALVQAWALERFTSIARRVHKSRQIAPTHSEHDAANVSEPDIETRPFVNTQPPREYTPPSHFTHLPEDIGELMTTSNNEYGVQKIPRWHIDGPGFGIGQEFESKLVAQTSLKQYALKNNRMLCTTRSSKWLLEQRCHGYQSNGCTWRIRLTTDESDVWTVKQFNPAHTCTGSQNNVSPTQLDVHVIADAVTPFVQARPHVRIKLLQTEIHTMYGRQISYKKAWNGKQRAIERIYGNWEESYNELPTLMKAIQDRNYGTEVEFVTIEWTTEEGDTITQFDRVFWSFAPSIEGFKHCPPVLVVDGTFMTGKYKHTLLMASSFDGNKNIFTVAFAIVDVESKETWEWFFDCI